MTYSAVQMKTARLELRISQELLDAVDAARGDVSRTRWVERALERALGLADPEPYKLPPSAPTPKPVATVKRASSLLADRQAKLNADKKS